MEIMWVHFKNRIHKTKLYVVESVSLLNIAGSNVTRKSSRAELWDEELQAEGFQKETGLDSSRSRDDWQNVWDLR